MPATEGRPANKFLLQLGGSESATLFRECSGIGGEVQVVEYYENEKNGENKITKVSGNFKYSDIVLKKGVTSAQELYNWWKKTQLHQDNDRVDGQLSACDETLAPVQTYSFKQGWISKFTGPTINTQSNEMAVEEITIVHEGLERVK